MASPIADVHHLEKLQPLGAIEQFSSARHHLGFYHNAGISASYTHPSLNTLTVRAAIFSALAIVIDRHPILSSIPVDEDSAYPCFARLPSIKLDEAVTFCSRSTPLQEVGGDVELDTLLQIQHNLPFKTNYGELPFWRLIILSDEVPETEAGCNFTASFIFHHSLGDGASGLTFHRHFLSALLSNPPPLLNTTIPTSIVPLTPNLELLHPFLLSTSAAVPNLPNIWSGTPISLPLTSNFHSLNIPAPTTKLFLSACRTNKTTVTATILVIIASALSCLLPEKFTDFEACIPVNLRRFLPAPLMDIEPMGVFIDAFSQYYTRAKLSPEHFWEEARRSKATINSYLEAADTHLNIAKLGKLSDMRSFFLSKVGEDRGSSFEVSNVGGVNMENVAAKENEEGWKMGRIVFSRSAFVSGSALSTGVVTGPDGCLVFGFVWQEGVVEKKLVQTVVEYVEREIERIAREG